MQLQRDKSARHGQLQIALWCITIIIGAAVTAPVAGDLIRVWRSNTELGHGPLLVLICAGLVWGCRAKLPPIEPDVIGSLWLLVPAALVHLTGSWLEIDLFRVLGLMGLLAGSIWLGCGLGVLRGLAGPLGLLLFSIPWPTSVSERLSFPLQTTSSAYATMLCGLLGQRIQQSGIQLSIMPETGTEPLYTILVSRACSGLTSLHVLLALGYLIAYLTPVRWPHRAALFSATIPIAVLANAVRLTFILLAGGHIGPEAARWVHDHEAPVLIALAGLLLVGLRAALLAGGPGASAPANPAPVVPPVRFRNGWSTPLLLSTFLGLLLAARTAAAKRPAERGSEPDFFQNTSLAYRDWQVKERDLDASERAQLAPDSVLVRQFESADGAQIELSTIAGRKRSTLHSPGSCLVGCGWERLDESEHAVILGDGQVRMTRALMGLGSRQLLVTYFFTDGARSAPTLLGFQAAGLWQQFRSRSRMQAVVRIVAPVRSSLAETQALSDDFLLQVVPKVLKSIRQAQ